LFESSQLSFEIADIADEVQLVSRTDDGVVTLDAAAAGFGWFSGDKDTPPGASERGVDLLSVLIHEIALQLGVDTQSIIPESTLEPGGRVTIPGDLGSADSTAPVVLTPLTAAGLLARDVDADSNPVIKAVLDEALARWDTVTFDSGDPLAALGAIQVVVDDLEGQEVARTRPDGTIVLDYSAAGHGWFVDADPFDDPLEFDADGVAVPGSAADGRVDLLTAIMHEIGHTLGLPHGVSELLSNELDPGVRLSVPEGTVRLVIVDAADAAALDAGLLAFETWAGDLGARLDSFLNGSPIPFIDTSLAEILGVELGAEQLLEAATAKLRGDIAQLFVDHPIVTPANFVALADTTSTEFRYQISQAASSDSVAFEVTMDLLPEGVSLAEFDLSSVNFDGLLDGVTVSTDLQIEITADLQLKFTFGLDPSGTFYVDDPGLGAELELSNGATPFKASVSLGPIGLGIDGGEISLAGSMALISRDRLSYSDLVNGTIDPFSLDPVTSGSYNIDLPIALGGALQGITSSETAIRASGALPAGAASLPAFIANIDPEFINFDQLFELRGISLDQLLDAISSGLDALIRPDGILSKKIPGIDQSLNELLGEKLAGGGQDFLTDLKDVIDTARDGDLDTVEDALNDGFNTLFDTTDDPIEFITITYEDSRILLDFSFDQVLASIDKSFSIDLKEYADQLGLTALATDLGFTSTQIDDLLSKVTIGDSAIPLQANIEVGVDFGIGLDLSDVINPIAFITSDSGIYARIEGGTSDVFDFNVAIDLSALGIGNVGFAIDDGMFEFGLDARFGLGEKDEGLYILGTDALNPEFSIGGDFDINLPLVFGSLPVGGSALDGDGDGLSDNVLSLKGEFGETFSVDVLGPKLDDLFSLGALLNDPQTVLSGLEGMFNGIRNQIQSNIDSVKLPLVGDNLDGASAFVDNLEQKLLGGVRSMAWSIRSRMSSGKHSVLPASTYSRS
jgi:hypothetical protein